MNDADARFPVTAPSIFRRPLVGEITRSGGMPQLSSARTRFGNLRRKFAPVRVLRSNRGSPESVAHHVRLSGRRRVHQRSDWVVAPNRQLFSEDKP